MTDKNPERPMYYDKDGTPLTSAEWIAKFSDLDYKRIGQDDVGDQRVSTVWLGLNHAFADDERPLIFETMVFPAGSWAEMCMYRYNTLAEAVRGHAAVVETLRKIEATEGLTDGDRRALLDNALG